MDLRSTNESAAGSDVTNNHGPSTTCLVNPDNAGQLGEESQDRVDRLQEESRVGLETDTFEDTAVNYDVS